MTQVEKHAIRRVLCTTLVLLSLPLVLQGADHPWQITSADNRSSVAFGFLAQGQAEWLTNPRSGNTSQNLFLRRLRLITGGQWNNNLSFFIETDSPNLGKAMADGSKFAERIYLQDAILSYRFRDEFQLDGGLLLFPVSHNTGQAATTLLPVDYSPYSFLASDPTDSRVGRDYGLQARGYLYRKHFEYRLGTFQGRRGTSASAPFRYSGRAVWYPFEADTGFFYTGTTLGTRKILALGASFDCQQDYHTWAADFFYDQPLFAGDGLTLQAGYTRYDGGTTFPQLAAQQDWLLESGYYFHRAKLGPFLQFAGQRFSSPTGRNSSKYLGGLAWWHSGHRFNLKLGVGRVASGGDPARIQVVLQSQIFLF
jgi:hypothetical protein